MSRSRKKHPYALVAEDKKYGKKFANRRIRRKSIIGNNSEYKKHYESWDIVDWQVRGPNDIEKEDWNKKKAYINK